MPTIATGAEFKRFYNDPEFWPEDEGKTWHDDTAVEINGVEYGSDTSDIDYNEIADNAKVKVLSGVVYGPKLGDDGVAFDTYFRRWQKKQNTVTLVVEVDKAKLEAVQAAVRAAGGKIVR